jgi:hypothetical protein
LPIRFLGLSGQQRRDEQQKRPGNCSFHGTNSTRLTPRTSR